MNIELNQTVEFCRLNVGSSFWLDNSLMMKIFYCQVDDRDCNCVYLSDGCLRFVEEDSWVIPANVKIVDGNK